MSASSGSMLAGVAYGTGTTLGDADAGTTSPPSNVQVCSREYLPRRKSPSDIFHAMRARCSDMKARISAVQRLHVDGARRNGSPTSSTTELVVGGTGVEPATSGL